MTEQFFSVSDSLNTMSGSFTLLQMMRFHLLWELKSILLCIYATFSLFPGWITLSAMDRLSRHRVNEKVPDLNFTVHTTDSTDTHKSFHLTAAKCTFFLSAWCVLCMIAYILHYKSHLSKLSKNKITPSMSSDYNNMKPTISNRKNFGKNHRLHGN